MTAAPRKGHSVSSLYGKETDTFLIKVFQRVTDLDKLGEPLRAKHFNSQLQLPIGITAKSSGSFSYMKNAMNRNYEKVQIGHSAQMRQNPSLKW